MKKNQARGFGGSSSAFGGSSVFGGSANTRFGVSSSPLSWISEPPDLSAISDPNVGVAFKNLTKKDSTTKTKALEELQTHVASEEQQIEDAVLEAWVKLYPRLSIDSARRVRQLSHTILGQISSKCGKRMVKHMPRVAGPWLAGAQDSDRAASRAAQESLKHVFNSPEKLQNLAKAFQQPILEHCRDAILHETVQTLSDERSVSPADAQATYGRVVATALAVISNLLSDLAPEEVAKQQDTYESIVGESKIWELASCKEDVVVRRHVHRFLRTCLNKQKTAVEANLSTISEAYIAKALPHDQTSSSYDFMQALVALTDAFPQAWTTSYTSKKSAGRRLLAGMKRGSQAGPAEFWVNAWALFSKLPHEVLPQKYSEAEELLLAVHEGVCQKDDRFNASPAWYAYFKIVDLVQSTCTMSDDEHDMLLSKLVLPVIEQYLRPSPSTSDWLMSGAKPAWNVSKAAFCRRLPSVLEKKWPEYANALVEDIKTSQPEQSKDFEKSQTHIASSAERWALLQSELLREEYQLPESLKHVFLNAAKDITDASLELLRSRNGKPYGAAATVDELQNRCGTFLSKNPDLQESVTTFVLNDLPDLLFSPSQRQLLALLYRFQTNSRFSEAWNKTASTLANSPDSEEKLTAFRNLLASPRVKPAAEYAAGNADIQRFLQRQYQSSISSGEQWSFISGVLQGSPSVASTNTADEILADLTSSLSISDRSGPALEGLQEISKTNRALVKEYIQRPEGSQLLPNLLLLEESSDESIVTKATGISKSIVDSTDKTASQNILFDVVHQSLREVSSSSLPMPQVLDMTANLIKEADLKEKKQEVAKQALPDLDAWKSAIKPFTEAAPSLSLAITSVLGGVAYLIDPDTKSPAKVSRDGDGLSQALRFAMYTTRTFSSNGLLEELGSQTQTELFQLFYLTYVLLTQSISLTAEGGLSSPNPDTEAETLEFVNEANKFIGNCFQQYDDASDSSKFAFVGVSLDHFFEQVKGTSASAFHHGQALSHALGDLESIHGGSHQKVRSFEDKALQLYKAKEITPFVACASGLKEALSDSKKMDRQTNELVADLTGLDAAQSPEKAIEKLTMLNALFPDSKQADAIVAKQRLIFLMKHLLPWLEQDEVVTPIKAETCKTLTFVLPGIADIYGEHWTQIMSFLASTWSMGFVRDEVVDESRMALMYTTLSLLSVLRGLKANEEPNDDLVDAWKESEEATYSGLMNLVRQGQGLSDEHHEPLKTVFQSLASEVAMWPAGKVEDEAELYPLLYTPSRALQRTAFSILHRTIPAAQEQISFDAALENKTAQLPEELLSLLIAPPTLDSLADASFRTGIPQELQAYLYSWQLVFDHFTNSSYKVKSDYVEGLREGEYLGPLLELTWELLGHTRGRPIDVSKYDIRNFDYLGQSGDVEGLNAEKQMHWLLAHLFYEALMHVPSLTKTHFLSLKSRQTGLAVESWTAKYVAPLIVNASLDSVSTWAESTVKTDPEYEGWNVKVSPRSREVQFSYLVDEQTMSIVIRLPETYPLASAKVEGLNRVAADERKWQSWLRNCQGVIQFSNGNLIDGLTTWRRNVTGALKGQSECAICYSIISGDRQLPSKKCSTCKNLFHSSCLFKWFKTSNASTCPLCRNAFNYG